MDSSTIASVCPKTATSVALAAFHTVDADASPTCSTSELSELTTIASSDSEALSGCSEGDWDASDTQSRCQTPEASPPPPEPKTQRTQLRSKASMFVPRVPDAAPVVVPMPSMPALCSSREKDVVPDIIRSAFGPFLKNLVVRETSLSTSVRVELKDLPRYAPDPETHEHMARSLSLQCLVTALDTSLGPKMFRTTPSGDGSRLSFEYYKMGTDRLCWEFLHGCCPRGGSCRWGHAVAQVFIVSLLLPPPPDPNQSESTQVLPTGSVPIVPVVVGADGTMMPLASHLPQQACQGAAIESDDDDSANRSAPSKSPRSEIALSSPVGSGLKTPSGRIAWADLEDSDEEDIA